MTKIKICGLRRPEDVAYANLCKPDYVGFVFAESKRKVTIEQARQLRKELSKEITAVGVFVNAPIEEVANLLNDKVIDLAQLHGDEDETYICAIRKRMERGGIIKAVRVASRESIRDCENMDVEYLLLDAFSEKAAGGTGETFNWEYISAVAKPFFLAGGISSENVQRAIAMVSPYGIDVSSGVETVGLKDKEKMMDIVTKVRQADKAEV